MTFWRIGWRRSGLLLKEFEFSALGGLHSYAVRDFLARNQAPYQWIDVETAQQIAEVRRLVEAVGAEASSLPMVLFRDGSSLAGPSTAQLAEKLGNPLQLPVTASVLLNLFFPGLLLVFLIRCVLRCNLCRSLEATHIGGLCF